MNVLHFGVTFWFNIYDEYLSLLENLKETMSEEFNSFNYGQVNNNNLLVPVITAINNDLKTNFHVTRISAQYNMDMVTLEDLDTFKEKSLNLFNFLIQNNIDVLYSSVVINSEVETEESLNLINKHLNEKIVDDDITETDLKIAKIIDEQFYKVIHLVNNKQIKIMKKVDEQNREVPIPLISLNGSFVEKECILIDYEFNDRYLYDFTSNYHTTEFHLNKMFHLIKENYESEIQDLIN